MLDMHMGCVPLACPAHKLLAQAACKAHSKVSINLSVYTLSSADNLKDPRDTR